MSLTSCRPSRSVLVLMGLAAAGTAIAAAPADRYPVRPVRMIIPFAPGGGTDAVGRLLAQHLGERYGQSFLVDNRPAGSGIVGAEIVARAPADGHTLLFTFNSFASSALLVEKLPYDPVRDFTPITLATTSPLLLLAHASVPVGNIKEMTAWVRANAGRVNYGSSGNGSPPHLGMELLMSRLGLSMTHIPYKGIGPATAAQLGNEVQFAFTPVLVGLPQMKAGKLKAIASGAARRSAAVPDIPTVAESGVPGFDLSGWWGLLGPAKLPRARVDDLNAAVRRILEDGDVRRNLLAQGMDPSPTTPEAFAEIIRNDMQTWGALGRKLGVKLD
ncbi:MAG: tripartite tricarboxylate transporter substrate binding protein [Pseudomonadota bacterium]